MVDKVNIRPAQRSDRKRIGELWWDFMKEQAATDERLQPSADSRDRWDNDFDVWLQDGSYQILVAEKGGEAVGFLTAQLHAPPPVYQEVAEVFVNELFVQPDQRQQGIATDLVRQITEWGKEFNVERLRLTALHDNDTSRSFWQSVGAVPFTATYTLEVEDESAGDKNEGKSRSLGFH